MGIGGIFSVLECVCAVSVTLVFLVASRACFGVVLVLCLCFVM